MNHLPPSPENNIKGVISNFFENSPRYSQVRSTTGINDNGVNDTVSTTPLANVPPVLPVSFIRWQLIGTILDCLYLTVNLKEKIYLYVNSTTQRCPNKIIKTFLIEDIFYLLQVSMTLLVHLELRISPRFLKYLKRP
jgi:hypothetical protein